MILLLITSSIPGTAVFYLNEGDKTVLYKKGSLENKYQ